jgi:hypothetical protein
MSSEVAIQQACPEGPLIGCRSCGDSVKPWVPLSSQDLTMCNDLITSDTLLDYITGFSLN